MQILKEWAGFAVALAITAAAMYYGLVFVLDRIV